MLWMGLSSQNKGVRTAMSELNKRPKASLLSPTACAATARRQPLNEVLSRQVSRQVLKRCWEKTVCALSHNLFIQWHLGRNNALHQNWRCYTSASCHNDFTGTRTHSVKYSKSTSFLNLVSLGFLFVSVFCFVFTRELLGQIVETNK